jgi:hypothetical protein
MTFLSRVFTFLSRLFVGQPLHILAVGLAGLMLHDGLMFRVRFQFPRTRPLLIAGIGWMLYGLWEWLVLIVTPEANIRVDLMLIWPALGLLSAYGFVRLLR